ncbi:hypothetical protein Syun_020161 [Stephania yunnanensis]|uniref:Uncharacterized protein n=1 Tax=Stephania yunnanensis TaxID=152371 RepID=A0AAP0NPD9_9MAGN
MSKISAIAMKLLGWISIHLNPASLLMCSKDNRVKSKKILPANCHNVKLANKY